MSCLAFHVWEDKAGLVYAASRENFEARWTNSDLEGVRRHLPPRSSPPTSDASLTSSVYHTCPPLTPRIQQQAWGQPHSPLPQLSPDWALLIAAAALDSGLQCCAKRAGEERRGEPGSWRCSQSVCGPFGSFFYWGDKRRAHTQLWFASPPILQKTQGVGKDLRGNPLQGQGHKPTGCRHLLLAAVPFPGGWILFHWPTRETQGSADVWQYSIYWLVDWGLLCFSHGKTKPNPIPGSWKYTEFGSLFIVARMWKQSKYPVTDAWI